MDRAARSQVFGAYAETYDEFRPGYPDAVIDLITADGPATALDVGCGTGKAAVAVAARGIRVRGIEPDARMAEVARRHGVAVEVSRFEDWPPERFDLVYSAQAWHWVDPGRAAAKTAEVLPAGGRWAAFWNDDDDERVHAALERAYSMHAPELSVDRADELRRPESAIAVAFRDHGGFDPIEHHEVTWVDPLDVAAFVTRLSTHSAHHLLGPEVAARVYAAITDDLGGPDARIDVAYTTLVLTARRR